MWWVIPFGLLLGLGAIAAISFAVELLNDLPREFAWIAMPVVASILVPITRPVVRAIGRWLRAWPRHEPTRLHLEA